MIEFIPYITNSFSTLYRAISLLKSIILLYKREMYGVFYFFLHKDSISFFYVGVNYTVWRIEFNT